MYHVSAQGVDERMINVHYYYDDDTSGVPSVRAHPRGQVALCMCGTVCLEQSPLQSVRSPTPSPPSNDQTYLYNLFFSSMCLPVRVRARAL